MPRGIVTKSGEDRFYTPVSLAKQIIDVLEPTGTYLEPCFGSGSFYNNVTLEKFYCEIDLDLDFFEYNSRVDWIITNPPFSIFRPFLSKCLEVADNVAFLCPINHFSTKARIRLINEKGFYIRKLILIKETPKEFPTSGFQWGVVLLQKQEGNCEISYL